MTAGATEMADRPLPPRPVEADPGAALRRCLERRFGAVEGIRHASFGGLTSFRLEVLTVDLSRGPPVKVLLKDFGASRLPKDGLEARREREMRVYAELLCDADLETAEHYGSIRERPDGPFWLLLEFVESVELRSLKFEAWVKAAAWLGRLHGRFARQGSRLEASGFLVRHDDAFFRSMAERALEAVTGRSAEWERRLRAALRGHDRAVEVMTGQPPTLVHGSFRPQNILLGDRGGATRVLAVDWELAALGAGLLDFAFLADGFESPRLDLLWEAYSGEAAPQGLALPGGAEMRAAVDCFRLHKTLKSLSDSVSLKFDEGTVLKLIGMAERLGNGLLE